ncbi:CDP-alcohol phosphatidyltransferase family protein [Halolamina litorea]|uniref:CDP-alcohol phosphatidyltransferase family protein n=1 Tax=Halolamina litorea TaxID=1515593 RepID=A0ABD6BVV7_9EURY|nr:CDP-alcohol phosphatidyltransferase family protein [Halolamina litorea]
MSNDATDRLLPRRLAVESVALGATALCVLAAGYWLFTVLAGRPLAIRWLAPTGALTAFVAGYAWTHRGTLRGLDGTRLDSLGLANGITLARAVLIAAVAGFVVVDVEGALLWAPAVGYGTAVLLDGVDGAVARTLGTETRLGQRLDMAVDTTGFVVAPAVAVAWDLLPVWYLLLSAARYCYRGGLFLWRRAGGSVGTLPPSRLRRPLAALQMAFLTVALLPPAPTPLIRTVAPVVLLPSLVVFARDWLAVTVSPSKY